MASDLTLRQRQIYDFLVRNIREKGYAPSIPEIGARFKIASTNGVADHLKALEKKGYIRRVGKRAIEVLSPLGKSLFAATRQVPVLGRVPAGKPLITEESVEGLMGVPAELARGETFILRVKGDSMIDAGILDGDYAIIRRQETAENGEIVCAMVNGEATLKRFLKKGGAVTLKAENKNYAPITVSEGDFSIVGKMVGLIRKF
ncbi:MAG TPA: transcriptional repressor LexA [Candidatus Acidoferrales bacterium]|nr:transcriptional repressor LexA [Candidatus Acidoferrales bacterium]